MNRFLGVVSLAVGAVFAVIAILVFIPFFNNFNASLIVLALIFGVLTWVLVAIGLQLFRPSGEARRRTAGVHSTEEPAEDRQVAASAPAPACLPVPDTSSLPAAMPCGSRVVEYGGSPAPRAGGNGHRDLARDQTYVNLSPARRIRFKKPGAPVPRESRRG